jgi:hypothetical protein
MAIEHKDLTGAQLHEPKGADTAADGTVYVADGSGSGAWENLLSSVYNLNLYPMEQTFPDLATAGSLYFNVPYKSEINKLNVLLYGAIDADTLITIYINGVLFADSLILQASGSAAGQKKTLAVTTPHSIPAGSIVTITSDGAATAAVKGEVQLEMEATA